MTCSNDGLRLLDAYVAAGAPTDAEFRATGYTAAARDFPLSDDAFARKCALNGVSPDQAPATWRYAPNRYCWEAWEGLRDW